MANEIECETCGGRGYTVEGDDKPVLDCPDCRPALDDEGAVVEDLETDRFERVSYALDSDTYVERRFDFGGEQ